MAEPDQPARTGKPRPGPASPRYRRAMVTVREGKLIGDIPCLVAGQGPPLIVLPGLTASSGNPTGFARSAQLRQVAPLTRHFTVYVLNRRPGLPAGYQLSDLADDFAAGIGGEFRLPVPVLGISTAARPPCNWRPTIRLWSARGGGRRVPTVGAGRQGQQQLVERIEAGQPRRAWAATGD